MSPNSCLSKVGLGSGVLQHIDNISGELLSLKLIFDYNKGYQG